MTRPDIFAIRVSPEERQMIDRSHGSHAGERRRAVQQFGEESDALGRTGERCSIGRDAHRRSAVRPKAWIDIAQGEQRPREKTGGGEERNCQRHFDAHHGLPKRATRSRTG